MSRPAEDRPQPAFSLVKPGVTAAVALTAASGFFLAGGQAGGQLAAAVIGTFFLACGSAALNQIQEREIDARMERTRRRVLPAGRVGLRSARLISAALIGSGAAILGTSAGGGALLIGLFTLVWYNAVYTGLKRVTAFAFLPGALTGALPPLIGWSAAGGALWSLPALCAAFFFFMWQIPHAWLLALLYGDELAAAGLPSPTMVFSEAQMRRIGLVWVWAAVLSGVTFPLVGLAEGWQARVYALLAAAVLWRGFSALASQKVAIRPFFGELNAFIAAAAILWMV